MRRTPKLGTHSRLFVIALAAILLIGLATATGVTAHIRDARNSLTMHGRGTGPVVTLDMTSPTSGWGWGPTLVVHTVDGAARLVDMTPAGVDSAHPILGEMVLDARHAWIVAGPPSGRGRFTVYRTRDGGAGWSAATVSDHRAGDITFIDPRHGWMQASRYVVNHNVIEVTLSRTLDGGASWSTIYRTRQRITIQPDGPTGDCQWSQARFSTPLLGVAGLGCDKTATPRIDFTNDGGQTWRRESLPPLRHPAGTLLFSTVQKPVFSGKSGAALVSVCAGSGTFCYEYGSLYRSVDGGRSWSAGQAVVRVGPDAVFADPAHAWLPDGCLTTCDSVPKLLRTRDGAHWTSMRLPHALGPNMHGSQQFEFVTPSLGFVVTTAEFDPHSHFFRTTDGAQTFHEFRPRIIRH